MRMQIVRIGNSKGIRLPKSVIEATGFGSEVEAELRGAELVLRAVTRNPREGWDDEFAKLIAAHGEPENLWPDDMHDDFERDWTWPGLEEAK